MCRQRKLTRRLALLVEQGVLEKRKYRERYEYHLTAKGYDAALLLIALMPFGEKWYFEDGREPVLLHDRRTGARVRPGLVDLNTGEPIDVRQLLPGPGPAFPEDADIRRARFAEYYARHDDKSEES